MLWTRPTPPREPDSRWSRRRPGHIIEKQPQRPSPRGARSIGTTCPRQTTTTAAGRTRSPLTRRLARSPQQRSSTSPSFRACSHPRSSSKSRSASDFALLLGDPQVSARRPPRGALRRHRRRLRSYQKRSSATSKVCACKRLQFRPQTGEQFLLPPVAFVPKSLVVREESPRCRLPPVPVPCPLSLAVENVPGGINVWRGRTTQSVRWQTVGKEILRQISS